MRTPLLLAFVAALPLSAVAQAPTPKHEETAIILSPFEVNSSADRGYYTGSSVSGSRIALPIKELPVPIGVVTEELLKDTLANVTYDIQESVRYASAVQISGDIASTFVRGWRTAQGPAPFARLRPLA